MDIRSDIRSRIHKSSHRNSIKKFLWELFYQAEANIRSFIDKTARQQIRFREKNQQIKQSRSAAKQFHALFMRQRDKDTAFPRILRLSQRLCRLPRLGCKLLLRADRHASLPLPLLIGSIRLKILRLYIIL